MDNNEHIDDQGRVFRTNPSGRGGLRQVTEDGWGDLYMSYEGAPAEQITDRQAGTVPRTQPKPASTFPRRVEVATPVRAEDGVSSTLNVCGWAGVALSVIVGGVILSNGLTNSMNDDVTFGAVLMIGGTIQSLLLVALARLLDYTRETARASHRTNELLAEALAAGNT